MINEELARSSSGALAHDLVAGIRQEVKLTKYNSLTGSDSYPFNQHDQIMQRAKHHSSSRSIKSLSASNLASEPTIGQQLAATSNVGISADGEFTSNTNQSPWTTVTSLNSLGDGCLASKGRGSYARRGKGEPFQVIWRRLSFEVDQSSYDQLIGESLRRLKSLWPSSIFKTRTGDTDSEEGFKAQPKDSLDSLRRTRKRLIFQNLNGYVNSGEITAILGPSGAGKTSLLNAICGRTGNYRGSVQLIGGGKRRMRMSIIPQKDYLMENLTVRENLLYSSKILNLDKNFDHEANILRVVRMLNLTNCFNSRASSISGGEYKRVSIAQELLRQPDILILDEPTSGLDSMNCKNLIKSLNELIEASRAGKLQPIAIVMTIHQPDVDIFQMFHHVYCMARGGRVIFDGHPSEALSVIKSHAGLTDSQLPVGLGSNAGNQSNLGINPANLLIEIASEQLYGQSPIDQLADYQRKQFELSFLSTSADASTNGSLVHGKKNSLATFVPGDSSPSSTKSSAMANSNHTQESQMIHDKRLMAKVDHDGHFWHNTCILAKRSFVSTIRDPLMIVVSLLFHLSMPFSMWIVYSKQIGSVRACPILQRQLDIVSLVSNETINKIEELQNEVAWAFECSTMYFLTTYSFSMCSLSVAALAFPLNMHILLKEARNGWYKLPSFVIAKTIASFPFEVLFPTISVILQYMLLGMPSSYLEWRMLATALVMALVAMISTTHGLVWGALFMDDVQSAIFLASATTLPMTLLSGFTARIRYMPAILQNLSYLSIYRYSSDLINIIRFGFGTCPCDQSTETYLQSRAPELVGLPRQMRSMMSYYLSNGDIDSSEINGTAAGELSERITGVNYELMLNTSARGDILKRLEADEVDLPGQMASLMSKSFTYGRDINDCSSVRSQILTTAGTPDDKYVPHLYAGLLILLVAYKLVLFVVVKYRIGRRI